MLESIIEDIAITYYMNKKVIYDILLMNIIDDSTDREAFIDSEWNPKTLDNFPTFRQINEKPLTSITINIH